MQLSHKPGCIWSDDEDNRKRGCFHRVPIDCCTVEDLLKELEKLRDVVESHVRKMEKMALRLYDLEMSGRDDY